MCFSTPARDAVSEDDTVSQAFREWVGESHWRWIKDCNPLELVRQIRADQIDILVDLRDILKAIDWMPFVIERLRTSQLAGLSCQYGNESNGLPSSDAIVEPHALADDYSTETIWHLPNGFHALKWGMTCRSQPNPPALKTVTLHLALSIISIRLV